MGTGGMRFGAGRPAYKGKAEACLRLDVRDLARRGLLYAGVSGNWAWSNSRTGERTGTISYSIEEDAAVLTYAIDGEPKVQWVPILRTGCNYGGARPWFACPHCSTRVAMIYFRRGGFHCRKCAQVAYYSQSEDDIDRTWQKQRKAEAKLGKGWSRPKGMHATTRDRLLQVIARCEEQRNAALAVFMARHFGILRVEGCAPIGLKKCAPAILRGSIGSLF